MAWGPLRLPRQLKIGRTSLGRSCSSRMLLGFLRIAAVEMARGIDPTIQIFDDDVVAFTRLIALLLLISATFPYLCGCRLSDAEAYHADGNCHTTPILRKVSSRRFTG